MTRPHVTELPLRLEPVEPDPFIELQSSVAAPRSTERPERERRMELVRRAMRIQARDGSTREGMRNGWRARPTERA